MEPLLGVAIGLVLTFAIVAVVVSSITELISAVTRLRARSLEMGIARMLDNQVKVPRGEQRRLFRASTDSPATAAVLQHPLIRASSAARSSKTPPSYINAITFATAFLGSTATSASLVVKLIPQDVDALALRIESMGEGEPGATVQAKWAESDRDLGKLTGALLADETHGANGLAKLVGPADEIRARITELEQAGDPTAAPIAIAWVTAEGYGDAKVIDFVQRLRRPDLVTSAVEGVEGISAHLAAIEAQHPYLGKSLTALWQRADDDFGKFRHEVEDWFDGQMARVSGWYSRWTQWIMVAAALVVALSLNISAFTIGKALWNDPTLRDKAVAAAEQQVSSTTTTSASGTPQGASSSENEGTTPSEEAVSAPAAADTLDEIGFPLGWNATSWPGWTGYLLVHLLGIVLVALAASFGAPFWFDALNKLVNLRTTGRPPSTAAAQRAVDTRATP